MLSYNRDDISSSDVKAAAMIDGHYVISVSPADALISATLTGVWTCETVDRYKADLLAAGSRLMGAGIDARTIGILIDTRAFDPQAQEVVIYYADAFSEPRFQTARIAVLYRSTLQKMQTRRMAVGTPHFFEKKDEAMSWLVSLR